METYTSLTGIRFYKDLHFPHFLCRPLATLKNDALLATISKAIKKNLPSFGLAPTNVKKLRG